MFAVNIMRRPIENAMKISEKMNAEWPIVFCSIKAKPSGVGYFNPISALELLILHIFVYSAAMLRIVLKSICYKEQL